MQSRTVGGKEKGAKDRDRTEAPYILRLYSLFLALVITDYDERQEKRNFTRKYDTWPGSQPAPPCLDEVHPSLYNR